MKKWISLAMAVAMTLSLVPATAFAEDDAKTTAKATDVAKVNDAGEVLFSVDEGDTVPVFYSGVSVKNTGITDNAKHVSLAVTVEEPFAGAWNIEERFMLTLPEGVYVVGNNGVNVKTVEGFTQDGVTQAPTTAWVKAFKSAYANGRYKKFQFKRSTFEDMNVANGLEAGKVTFALTLVAEPWFEGDVVLGLEGAEIEPQEVVIATFVKPYTVEAEQNEVIIGYRSKTFDTPIIIMEAAGGLLQKDATFELMTEKDCYLEFEEAIFDVSDSGVKLNLHTTRDSMLAFTIEAKSKDATTITICDIDFFMPSAIVPVGIYDLTLRSSLYDSFRKEVLFGHKETIATEMKLQETTVVKEDYVNIISPNRGQEGNDFITKVVVPVGENYLISDEVQIALDAPAYITESGYTMLPVRAVATALGINNNNVLWDNEEKKVIILFGQRIVTMSEGDTVVDVNGSTFPASAEVEIKNGRVFLPMRDLARALSITDITWDGETKTAILNGSDNK